MNKVTLTSAIAGGVLCCLGATAQAEEIEWKYFASDSIAKDIAAGKLGYDSLPIRYNVCTSSPEWEKSASKDALEAFFFKPNYSNYPAVPTEGNVFHCIGSNDVMGVNWTEVTKTGKQEQVLKIMKKITSEGFTEVTFPSE